MGDSVMSAQEPVCITKAEELMIHGPITRAQHDRITGLSEQWVRQNGYCYLAWWVPGHSLHRDACQEAIGMTSGAKYEDAVRAWREGSVAYAARFRDWLAARNAVINSDEDERALRHQFNIESRAELAEWILLMLWIA